MGTATGWNAELAATLGPRNHVSDLRGVSRLAVDGATGLTGLIQAMHVDIASLPAKLGGPLVESTVHGVAGLVYRSIHGVTRAGAVASTWCSSDWSRRSATSSRHRHSRLRSRR